MSLLDQRDDSIRLSSSLSLSEKLTNSCDSLQLMEKIYGVTSSPVAAIHIQRAYFNILENQTSDAEKELLLAGRCAEERDLPLELTIVALYLCGLVGTRLSSSSLLSEKLLLKDFFLPFFNQKL
jgi:hypothetical protein